MIDQCTEQLGERKNRLATVARFVTLKQLLGLLRRDQGTEEATEPVAVRTRGGRRLRGGAMRLFAVTGRERTTMSRRLFATTMGMLHSQLETNLTINRKDNFRSCKS